VRKFFSLAIMIAALIAHALAPRAVLASTVDDFIASGFARANEYRAMAGLPLYELDPALSRGATSHARYLVENGIADGSIVLRDKQIRIKRPPTATQWEEPKKPFYTAEGANAAIFGIVTTARKLDISGADFVDQIMAMPFSGMYGVLFPQLRKLGVGGYCNASECATVIVFRAGLTQAKFLNLYTGSTEDRMWNPHAGLMPIKTESLKSAIEFPPNGSTVDLGAYRGADLPDALSACTGYSAPTGFGISLQLGQGNGAQGSIEVADHSLTHDGTELDSCVITKASYKAHADNDTNLGQTMLNRFGAILIVPRTPLAPGLYHASVTADSKQYSWSFTVAAQRPIDGNSN
jgi:hypothetical protein